MGNITQVIALHFLGLILFVPSETSSKNLVKIKVYVIKFTEFGTDPGLNFFSFFTHVDLEKINCASADVKQVIFVSWQEHVPLKHKNPTVLRLPCS